MRPFFVHLCGRTRVSALHLIDEEEMVVAVPSSHPLAQRPDLEIRDLAEETFVLYPRTERPGLADTVIAACEKAGFAPKVKQYTPQLSSTINLVAASLGISIVPRSMRGLQPEAVTYKKLRDPKMTALLGVAHRAGETSAPVLRFIETLARASNLVNWVSMDTLPAELFTDPGLACAQFTAQPSGSHRGRCAPLSRQRSALRSAGETHRVGAMGAAFAVGAR